MYNSKIVGAGKYLPERVLTNFDLEKIIDTSDAWIRERSGIVERHFADIEKGETNSFMGAQASLNALKMAGLKAEDIAFIVYATISSEYYFPGTGCLLQVHLGIPGVGALDIRTQCTGFVYGVAVADQFIKSGMYKNILVVGSELQSHGLNLTTEGRDIAVLFGDGAGAAVLTATEEKGRGVLSSHLHADGNFTKNLWCENPGSTSKPYTNHEMVDDKSIYPHMDGKHVFKNAVTKFPEVIQEALDANNLCKDDVDLVIPHQANERITEAVQKRLGLTKDKVYRNIHKYGNTTAASIPIALTEAIEEGLISDGKLICLAAFGSGFTWASNLIRW